MNPDDKTAKRNLGHGSIDPLTPSRMIIPALLNSIGIDPDSAGFEPGLPVDTVMGKRVSGGRCLKCKRKIRPGSNDKNACHCNSPKP